MDVAIWSPGQTKHYQTEDVAVWSSDQTEDQAIWPLDQSNCVCGRGSGRGPRPTQRAGHVYVANHTSMVGRCRLTPG